MVRFRVIEHLRFYCHSLTVVIRINAYLQITSRLQNSRWKTNASNAETSASNSTKSLGGGNVHHSCCQCVQEFIRQLRRSVPTSDVNMYIVYHRPNCLPIIRCNAHIKSCKRTTFWTTNRPQSKCFDEDLWSFSNINWLLLGRWGHHDKPILEMR